MDPGLAEWVLKSPSASMRDGSGRGGVLILPDDVAGVWTAADDADLQGSDSRGVRRVAEKHGAEGLVVRWEFLEELRGESGG